MNTLAPTGGERSPSPGCSSGSSPEASSGVTYEALTVTIPNKQSYAVGQKVRLGLSGKYLGLYVVVSTKPTMDGMTDVSFELILPPGILDLYPFSQDLSQMQ